MWLVPAPQVLLGLFIFVSWWAACAARQPLPAQGLGAACRRGGSPGGAARLCGRTRVASCKRTPAPAVRVRGGTPTAGGCIRTLTYVPLPTCLSSSFPVPCAPPNPDVSGTTGAAGCRVLGGRRGKGRRGAWGLALTLLGIGSETLGLAPFGPQLPIEAQKATCLWIPEQGLERNNMDTRARGHLVAPLPEHARGPPITRGPDTMVAVDAPAAGLPSRGLLPGNTRPTPHATRRL